MLLQQIVGALDKELDRLVTLRTIVSGLQGTFSIDFDEAQPLLSETDATPDHTVSVPAATTPKKRRTPAIVERRVKAAEVAKLPKPREPKDVRALSSTIPAGPVVVMPAALAREHAARRDGQTAARQQAPPPERGSLGSMIRALHLDATA